MSAKTWQNARLTETSKATEKHDHKQKPDKNQYVTEIL